MSQGSRHPVDYNPPRLLLDRLGRPVSLGLAGALVLAIGVADYLTGYALRLSPLYLLPIAIAAWAAGPRGGLATAVIASLLWLFSFSSEHFYRNYGFYIWEALGMLAGFSFVVWLVVRLRRALSQADERFVRMLEEVGAAVYVVDEERGSLLYANPEMQRLESRLPQLDAPALEAQFIGEPVADVRSEGRGFVSRTVRHATSGRWYQLQAGAIPWGNRRHVKLKVLSDITAQKSAQQLREQRRESVHQASRLTTLAEIASTLAHEINQPLMAIATYTDACQRLLRAPHADHQEIIGVLGRCHAQAVRASAIIERLREFIRQRRHQSAPWSVEVLLGEAVDVSRPLLEEAQVEVDNAGVAADLQVVGDRVLLVQLLVNLIRNGIEAMRTVPAGERRLTISAAPSSDAEVLIAVADRGCGLPPLAAEELFAPFVTTKDEGLGLGLAICRSVAESHQGRLWATDNAGGGATFHLALPLASPA